MAVGLTSAGGAVAAAPASPSSSGAAPAPSSANVAPRVSGAQLAALNARRRQLFKRMMADPANVPLSLRYAKLSSRAGDLEAAISTLERLSLFAPDLARIKLDLGGLYYRLGAYDQARLYLQRALNGSTPAPPDVRAGAKHYLALIRQHGGATP